MRDIGVKDGQGHCLMRDMESSMIVKDQLK